jgi:hypothetical protein
MAALMAAFSVMSALQESDRGRVSIFHFLCRMATQPFSSFSHLSTLNRLYFFLL